ncbi:heme-degrading domain-containing protein [Microbacterium hominis]|uniref:Heme-binding protein n=1 Tax=Microbacterium hominis TaxID=162426 RepID=A0A7D4TDU0_9MICO|nr:heme-binding protein [Microbacterium hominis]QKJ18380.1 heme-binding protein [Microbacterium hominis]
MDLDRPLELDKLAAQEAVELRAFDHDAAWRLGSGLRDRAATAGYGIAIDIRRPTGAVLFHAALPGATADQEEWIRRKVAVVWRFEASSALVSARLRAAGKVATDPAAGWLAAADYAVTGGAVPIRVAGAGIVAALTVSGLSSVADHRLAVDAIVRLRDDV